MHRASRLSLFAAVATAATAALLAVAVIPPVRADTFPGAAPERAALAFWVNVMVNLLVAAQAFAAYRVPARRRTWTGVAGLVAVVLGLALIDAAAAFAGHGPGMRTAVVALWICVGLDLAGGASMIASAFMRRRTDRE